jgi:DNA-binding response OmpR family regulator
MPAEVVIVHPDSGMASTLAHAFQARGWTVRYYADPPESASLIELLLTCVKFDDGRSNGQALALMTRSRRPNVKLLFMCAPGDEQHVSDLGERLEDDHLCLSDSSFTRVAVGCSRNCSVSNDRFGMMISLS